MEDGNTAINGLYGPDPVLWTFFMFLHFVVATVFIIFSAIAYSKWSLNQKNNIDLVIMFTMIVTWFLLYYIARLNRRKGILQMEELQNLMEKVIL
ncbi:MAG: GTP-binding protein [Flavobacterium sp.]|nr:GTP-binding protein [Flavobacterium sp.]